MSILKPYTVFLYFFLFVFYWGIGPPTARAFVMECEEEGGWNGMLGLLGNIYSTCLACRNKNRLEKGQGVAAKKRCCYRTVYFAPTALQNDLILISYPLQIFRKMTKL